MSRLIKPIPISTPVAVSTLTPLVNFIDYSYYQGVLLHVENVDSTNAVTVFFETSEDGVSVDATTIYTLRILPGQQFSLAVGPVSLRTKYFASAETDGPGFPTAMVTFGVNAQL